MREIKFRGLRTDGKGWVYGGFTFDAIDNPRITTKDKSKKGLIFHEVLPESVGQLILVSDGLEVYSNQLVRAYWEKAARGRYFQSSDAYVERYVDGMFQWKNFGYMFKTKEGQFITIPSCAKFEIIKNIHETETANK